MPKYVIDGFSNGRPIRARLSGPNLMAAARKAWFPVTSARLYTTKAEDARHAAHARRLFRQLVKGPVQGVAPCR